MNIEKPHAYFSITADTMMRVSTGSPMATNSLATLRKDKQTRARARLPLFSFLHTPVHQVKCREQNLVVHTSPSTSPSDETSFPTAKTADIERRESNYAYQRRGTSQEIIRR